MCILNHKATYLSHEIKENKDSVIRKQSVTVVSERESTLLCNSVSLNLDPVVSSVTSVSGAT